LHYRLFCSQYNIADLKEYPAVCALSLGIYIIMDNDFLC